MKPPTIVNIHKVKGVRPAFDRVIIECDYWLNAPLRAREWDESYVCSKCGMTLKEASEKREIGGTGPGLIYWHHEPDGGYWDINHWNSGLHFMWDANGHEFVYEPRDTPTIEVRNHDE